jgi:hypothetical protein
MSYLFFHRYDEMECFRICMEALKVKFEEAKFSSIQIGCVISVERWKESLLLLKGSLTGPLDILTKILQLPHFLD